MKKMMEANNELLDQLGVVQHHDAITGTAKQYVSNDYSWHLYKAKEEGRTLYGDNLKKLVKQ